MGGIDWTNIPLEEFLWVDEEREDGKGRRTIWHPHGDGVGQLIMTSIRDHVEDAYGDVLSDEDGERYETAGENPCYPRWSQGI